jgi:hypothetical protein
MKSKGLREKIGKLPGTLVYTGDKPVDKVLFKLVKYDPEGYTIHEFSDLDDALKGFDETRQNWLKVKGLNQVEFIAAAWAKFHRVYFL